MAESEETPADLVEVDDDDAVMFGMTTDDLGQMVIRTITQFIIGTTFMVVTAKLSQRLNRRKVTEVTEEQIIEATEAE